MRYTKFLPLLVSLAFCRTLLAADPGHALAQSRDTNFGLGRPLPPGWEPAIHDSVFRTFTFIDRAEFRGGGEADAAVWDVEGWMGGDYNRFWWKVEGEQLVKRPKSGEVEIEALYGRLFAPFWDFQAGLRVDRAYSGPQRETRGHLVVGVEGLMPYWFEVEPALAVSDKGKVSFTFTTTYDLLLTQRLVLQPRVDLRLDAEKEEAAPTGFIAEGRNDLDLSMRLRYDISRQFSPYVGVEWHRALGASAGVVRGTGGKVWSTTFVFGVRSWF